MRDEPSMLRRAMIGAASVWLRYVSERRGLLITKPSQKYIITVVCIGCFWVPIPWDYSSGGTFVFRKTVSG